MTMTMTVDRFDVLWFLAFQAVFVLTGFGADDIWFLEFGAMAIFWFREPLGDWLGDKAANKMRQEIHAGE